MSCNRINITSGLALMLISAAAAYAGESIQDIRLRIGPGNPYAGKLKSVLCQTCHGETGNSNLSNSPKLSGQYAMYIVKQMRNYQTGLRKDPAMSRIAATLINDQDLLDIAAYFASRRVMRGSEMLINRAGEARYMDSGRGCESCHGENGKGLGPGNPSAPVIGGQNKEYLVEELEDFREGLRTNDASGIMPMVASLMTDDEIEAVSSYLSGQ